MLSRLNKPAFLVLIVYPVLLLGFLGLFLQFYGLSTKAILLTVVGFYGSNIAVGIGLHRLWSHNSYKAHPLVEFMLSIMAAGTLQGPIFAWASDHYRHHTFTDKDKDPHTPKKFHNPVLGFLWAHIGWMLFEKTPKVIDRVAMVKLGRNKIVMWQLKHYWTLAILMNTLVPAMFGFLMGGTLQSAIEGFLFIGLGRMIQQHFTFMVNSVCHFWGRRPYSQGTARDVWWLALFLLGENWHNFHHAFPSDYRNGHKWYHFDAHKWIIAGLAKIGLAYDLDQTEAVRIRARIQQKNQVDLASRQEKLQLVFAKIDDVNQHLTSLMNSLPQLGQTLQKSMEHKLTRWQHILQNFQKRMSAYEHMVSKKSLEKRLRRFEKKMASIEKSLNFYLVRISSH